MILNSEKGHVRNQKDAGLFVLLPTNPTHLVLRKNRAIQETCSCVVCLRESSTHMIFPKDLLLALEVFEITVVKDISPCWPN